MRQVVGVVIGTVILVNGMGALAQTPAPDPAKVAAGKQLFADTKCTKCHGENGKGDKDKKLVLQGISAKLSAAEIRKWIATPTEMTAKLPHKPVEPMKKFDLTDAQIDQLVAYVQSLKK